jgi:hypothetical protein
MKDRLWIVTLEGGSTLKTTIAAPSIEAAFAVLVREKLLPTPGEFRGLHFRDEGLLVREAEYSAGVSQGPTGRATGPGTPNGSG